MKSFVLQALYIPRSRLNKYVDISQLPEELGGKYIYNHSKWIENRLVILFTNKSGQNYI